MKALTTIVVIALAGLVACGGEVRQSPKDPELTGARVPDWPNLGRGSARFIRIDLGPDTFAECRRLSPKFPFDSAETYAQERVQLRALAACLNMSEMQDRKLVLVGRADPKGTDDYNDRLGTKRANAIRQILIENGISADRIQVVSEGERGARGDTAETSAGYDRRVDIMVKGGHHTP